MYHLVYSSVEKQPFSSSELKALLMSSRMRNRDTDVTGILVYSAGTFLQALEGDEGAVRAVFSRIEKDPRHGNMRALRRQASLGKRRMFGDWSMAFADAAGATRILKGYIDLKSPPDLSALNEAQAMEILMACSKDAFAGSHSENAVGSAA